MQKFAGHFGRPKKTPEEIIEEFQEEWDELEFREEPEEENYMGETYDGEPIEEYTEEYEEDYPEDEILAEEPAVYCEEMPEREVIYRAERFNIVCIECVTERYFFPSHIFFVNIAYTQCHVFILRKFERHTIVYFISCQTNIHINFACFFIKQTYFCFIGLFFNR